MPKLTFKLRCADCGQNFKKSEMETTVDGEWNCWTCYNVDDTDDEECSDSDTYDEYEEVLDTLAKSLGIPYYTMDDIIDKLNSLKIKCDFTNVPNMIQEVELKTFEKKEKAILDRIDWVATRALGRIELW